MSKRKRPEPKGNADTEVKVLDLVKSKKNMGISTNELRRGVLAPQKTVDNAAKSLVVKKLIKEVVNIHKKGRGSHYMAVEFEPSMDLSGGDWYNGGTLDTDFINTLKELCSKIVRKHPVITAKGISDFINKNKISHTECTEQQIKEIVKSLVLDNVILEVKSTGLGEYHSIPVGDLCYRFGNKDVGPKFGAMSSIPCGVCPRISDCTPDGIISPTTCVYYKKWLEF